MTDVEAPPPPIDFQVLGPLQVVSASGPQPLGGPKQRAILGLLLINRNRVVSMDSLIAAVWEDNPPPAIVSSIHVAISALRRIVPAGEARASGLLETVTRAIGSPSPTTRTTSPGSPPSAIAASNDSGPASTIMRPPSSGGPWDSGGARFWRISPDSGTRRSSRQRWRRSVSSRSSC